MRLNFVTLLIVTHCVEDKSPENIKIVKLNNVDRGMNVVVINLEGKSPRYSTFDLYGHDSTDLKAFLNLLQPGEVPHFYMLHIDYMI